MDEELKTQLAEWLSERTQAPFRVRGVTAAHGGCIHQTYVFEDGNRSYFVKLNHASRLDLFEAEVDGLAALARTGTLRVPSPIGCGVFGKHSFLAMERLRFGPSKADGWAAMGHRLAELHRCSGDAYGWPRDNYIGASPQPNRRSDDWADFFREQRLRPQFAMAERAGIRFENAARLLDSVADLLDGHELRPSLLHGDLWSGNASFLEDGSPVIYDPACYHGDRETDLAFSEFFGGFPATFYAAYEAAWPLPAGFAERKELYNLYHVLNHANLFGGAYVRQAEAMVEGLIL